MRAFAAAAFAGILFALGLGLGGMTDPSKVVGFLDVAGSWDPSLAFVMAGALGTYSPLRALIQRRKRPVLAPTFPPPGKKTGVDARLLTGAALFGIGWGLLGDRPGPALVSVATGARRSCSSSRWRRGCCCSRRGSGSSAAQRLLVRAHQLRRREHVAFHLLEERVPGHRFVARQFGVQRVDGEDVPVPADGRARTSVAHLSPVVQSLARARGQLSAGHAFGQGARCGSRL